MTVEGRSGRDGLGAVLMTVEWWMGVQQLSTYEAELEEMKNMSRQEYVASLRR